MKRKSGSRLEDFSFCEEDVPNLSFNPPDDTSSSGLNTPKGQRLSFSGSLEGANLPIGGGGADGDATYAYHAISPMGSALPSPHHGSKQQLLGVGSGSPRELTPAGLLTSHEANLQYEDHVARKGLYDWSLVQDVYTRPIEEKPFEVGELRWYPLLRQKQPPRTSSMMRRRSSAWQALDRERRMSLSALPHETSEHLLLPHGSCGTQRTSSSLSVHPLADSRGSQRPIHRTQTQEDLFSSKTSRLHFLQRFDELVSKETAERLAKSSEAEEKGKGTKQQPKTGSGSGRDTSTNKSYNQTDNGSPTILLTKGRSIASSIGQKETRLLSIQCVDDYWREYYDILGLPAPLALRGKLLHRLAEAVLRRQETQARRLDRELETCAKGMEEYIRKSRKDAEQKCEQFELYCESIVDDFDVSPEEKKAAAKKVVVLQKALRHVDAVIKKETATAVAHIEALKEKRRKLEARIGRQKLRVRAPLQGTSKTSTDGERWRDLSLTELAFVTREEADSWRERQDPMRVTAARIQAKKVARAAGDWDELSRLEQGELPKMLLAEDADEVSLLEEEMRQAIAEPSVSFELFYDVAQLAAL